MFFTSIDVGIQSEIMTMSIFQGKNKIFFFREIALKKLTSRLFSIVYDIFDLNLIVIAVFSFKYHIGNIVKFVIKVI